MTIKEFKSEFRQISTDTYSDALDVWFEAVGQMYVRGLEIPEKYEYRPAKSLNSLDNIEEDNYFHEMFNIASSEQITNIAEFLFRFCRFTKDRRVVVEDFDDEFYLYDSSGQLAELDPFDTYEEAVDWACDNGFKVVESFFVV